MQQLNQLLARLIGAEVETLFVGEFAMVIHVIANAEGVVPSSPAVGQLGLRSSESEEWQSKRAKPWVHVCQRGGREDLRFLAAHGARSAMPATSPAVGLAVAKTALAGTGMALLSVTKRFLMPNSAPPFFCEFKSFTGVHAHPYRSILLPS
jgi:hypothetical protein